jgi:hypothetical protein
MSSALDVGSKRAAEEDIDNEEAKIQRVAGDACASADPSTDKPSASFQPAPPLEEALSSVSALCGTKLELGRRIEVSWEVIDDAADAEEKEEAAAGEHADPQESIEVEPEPEHVWWGGTLAELVGLDEKNGLVWKIVYDAKNLDGKEFAPEERNVTFCGERPLHSASVICFLSHLIWTGKNMLIDLESNERKVGGGDVGLMQWRVEGSGDELPALLPVGLRFVPVTNYLAVAPCP